ncbi:MAG TPA: hypothetical protein VE130_09270 [Nitrososphaeraceae archaeon]|jgi:predicted transcriptional regulator|nr:hypothetical protein [Nitrososphaeraceae archaeon]
MVNIAAELDLSAVKIILDCSNSGYNLNSMAFLTNMPDYALKVYLFHLLEYNMISYSGDKHLFVTTREGQRLLSMINETNQIANFGNNEYIATITLE